jgi:hypothetical protein
MYLTTKPVTLKKKVLTPCRPDPVTEKIEVVKARKGEHRIQREHGLQWEACAGIAQLFVRIAVGAEILTFLSKAFKFRQSFICSGSLHEKCFETRYAAARFIRPDQLADLYGQF